MNKKVFVKTGCIFLCSLFLTGCAGLGKLESPYEFSERTALYQSGTAAGKAEPFANDLCVVSEDTPFSDGRVTAEAAAVFDIKDREVLFAKNPFERLYPASVTKVMTALVALEHGDLTDEVTVTRDAVITEAGATLCGIKPGDKLSMEQLLYGLMLPSGNDAGVAIAIHMAGSEEAFSKMMNEEALKLGATGSQFVNPHGLHDQNHYTTAYDLYLIFNKAMEYPKFREIIAAKEFTASYKDATGSPVSAAWKATNWYMTGEKTMPSGLTVSGGKTGTTQAAGNCLIMGSSDSSGREYISVVLKAPGRPGLYDNMSNILNKIVE
ncbi:MAG: D-alanyl-D-alanine carboxypeptidase family protein [Lacrimispora sp.]|uniref:D-alanyl-D-alanine carboxypeptidase family protein n=1 Tax=Lacrimispora sp. TaxID=2719234 RepID=UPI0039E66EF2